VQRRNHKRALSRCGDLGIGGNSPEPQSVGRQRALPRWRRQPREPQVQNRTGNRFQSVVRLSERSDNGVERRVCGTCGIGFRWLQGEHQRMAELVPGSVAPRLATDTPPMGSAGGIPSSRTISFRGYQVPRSPSGMTGTAGDFEGCTARDRGAEGVIPHALPATQDEGPQDTMALICLQIKAGAHGPEMTDEDRLFSWSGRRGSQLAQTPQKQSKPTRRARHSLPTTINPILDPSDDTLGVSRGILRLIASGIIDNIDRQQSQYLGCTE